MGTDLYANAVAAHYLYPEQKKIIIDFGTALTLTGVAETGQMLGVIIAPGVVTSLQSLVNSTAQLPYIELNEPKISFRYGYGDLYAEWHDLWLYSYG